MAALRQDNSPQTAALDYVVIILGAGLSLEEVLKSAQISVSEIADRERADIVACSR